MEIEKEMVSLYPFSLNQNKKTFNSVNSVFNFTLVYLAKTHEPKRQSLSTNLPKKVMRKLGKAKETPANKQIPRIKGEELVTINDHMQMPVVEK